MRRTHVLLLALAIVVSAALVSTTERPIEMLRDQKPSGSVMGETGTGKEQLISYNFSGDWKGLCRELDQELTSRGYIRDTAFGDPNEIFPGQEVTWSFKKRGVHTVRAVRDYEARVHLQRTGGYARHEFVRRPGNVGIVLQRNSAGGLLRGLVDRIQSWL